MAELFTMLILLVAWLFWLALNGRLGTYAAFVTTGASGGGSLFSGFSIPISITGGLGGGGSSPQQALPPHSPATTGNTSPAMPTLSQYQSGLPSGDRSIFGLTQGALTGFYPSGLPAFGTLDALTNQAGGNVAGGAAGL